MRQLWLKLQMLFYNRLKHIAITCGEGCKISKFRLASCGKNNTIVLGDNVVLENVTISIFGNDNHIIIKDNNHFCGIRFAMEDDGNRIEIGKHNFIGCGNLLAALEGTNIVIGDDCMIASTCEIRTSDSHSLLDENGKRINYAQDIFLGGARLDWYGMLGFERGEHPTRLRRCSQVCGMQDEGKRERGLSARWNSSKGVEGENLMESQAC